MVVCRSPKQAAAARTTASPSAATSSACPSCMGFKKEKRKVLNFLRFFMLLLMQRQNL